MSNLLSEIMEPKDDFEVGDPCFARVKGWGPYPARIVQCLKKAKRSKFLVHFYETEETGQIWCENLWSITPENIKKLVTEKSLKKKYFKSALDEMRRVHQDVDFVVPPDAESGLKVDKGDLEEEVDVAASSDDEFDFEFNYNKTKKDSDSVAQKQLLLSKIITGSTGDSEDSDDDVLPDLKHAEATNKDNTAVREVDDSEVNEHILSQEITPLAVGDGIDTVGDDVVEKARKKGAVKVSKSKKIPKTGTGVEKPAKSKKTLRESEVEANEAFAEKIVTSKDDRIFTCRMCPFFVTSVKILARSHALSCGVKKKAGRHAKKVKCDECGEEFEGRMNLMKHVKMLHTMPSYQCSTCLRKFKSRGNYKKHLLVHSTVATVPCPYCPKVFRFQSYKLRHIKRVHTEKFGIRKKTVEEVSEDRVDQGNTEQEMDVPGHPVDQETTEKEVPETSIEQENMDMNKEDLIGITVSQREERFGPNYYWQLESSFPVTDRTKSSSYTQFYSSLGLYSREDWDDWMEVSKMLNMNITEDNTVSEGFEVAVITEANGDETVLCAGCYVFSTDFVRDIVLELVDNVFRSELPQPLVQHVANQVVGGGSNQHLLEQGGGAYGGGVEGADIVTVSTIEQVLNFQEQVEEEVEMVAFVDGTSDVPHFGDQEHAEEHVENIPSADNTTIDSVNVTLSKPGGKEQRLISCEHCGASGFKDGWYLRRHITLMHTGSVQCNICSNIFIDKHKYLQHAKTCYYWCDVAGCSYHEKRKSRVDSHMRSHERDS